MESSAAERCIVRLEFASEQERAEALERAREHLAAATEQVLPGWSAEAEGGLGARKRLPALILGFTFVAGVAEGVAGNLVFEMLKGAGAQPGSSVMGSTVAIRDREAAQSEVVQLLQDAGCLRAPEPRVPPGRRPR